MYKIGIVGAKNSGKTTLIKKIIHELSSMSIKVISKKHTSHKHNFDTIGKDSYQHRQAGAKVTIAINPSEFAVFGSYNEPLLSEIEELLNKSYDICLIEGDKFSDIPKVLLTRKIEEIKFKDVKNVIATFGDESSIKLKHFHSEELTPLCSFIILQFNKYQTFEKIS